MISKVVIQIVIFVAFGLLLFIAAGTVQWPAAWVLMAETGAGGIALGLWLSRHDPSLLAERLSVHYQAPWDKALVAALIVSSIGAFVLMGFDAVRFHWSEVPLSVRVLGAFLILLSIYFNYLVFRENTFAAPAVRIQTERGHRVVSTGPYAYVRHPMYTGVVFFYIGVPLLLGSWYGLAGRYVQFVYSRGASGARGKNADGRAGRLSRVCRARALSPHYGHLVGRHHQPLRSLE
jgi:protein-S-isoprenylcysteine O-methyltransferase Ste14